MSANDLDTTIVEVTPENIAEHPQAICFINAKHPLYGRKLDWLREQHDLGLKIKLLYLPQEKRPVGFVEYVPGEHCWRAVDASGYVLVHCLWTNGKKYQHRGLGSTLIREVEQDASTTTGVCALTSDKSFMANSSVFLKNQYVVVSECGKEQLVAKQFAEGPLPTINDWSSELENHVGLTILYTRQCPWVARFIEEVRPILDQRGLNPTIRELKTAAEAQRGPSLYASFSLIYDGKLLADRYVSTTRFANILDKEMDT